MMENNIEEMQLAILTECDLLKPSERGIETAWGAIYDLGDHYQFWIWGSFHKLPKQPNPKAHFGVVLAIYRMMGLEAAETVFQYQKALEAATEMMKRQKEVIDFQESRYAKLVTLLSDLDTRFGYTKKRSDLSNFQGIKVPNAFHFLIQNALEEFKEGAPQG